MKNMMMLVLVMFSLSSYANDTKLDLLRYDYSLNQNTTYRLTVTQKMTALTDQGAATLQQFPISYSPDAETFKLIHAYVTKANGRKIHIDPKHIFTRSAQTPSTAPGFDARLTATLVFPTLAKHDAIVVAYQLQRTQPPHNGFSYLSSPQLGTTQDKLEVIINAPKNLHLKWHRQGPFKVSDHLRGERRWIRATLTEFPARAPEANMVDLGENKPYFLVSTTDSWQQFGRQVWDDFQPKMQITPDIQQLAQRLTHNLQGVAAVEAINNWVAQHIHYIAVFLDESNTMVPHDADSVLKNGYGDCKDHAVLMLALLRAAHIEAYPTLINAMGDYTHYPLPCGEQFNHAIVYIPSIDQFADPTNAFGKFGVLSNHLANKRVLICSTNAYLRQTPMADRNTSTYRSVKTMTLNERGDINGQGTVYVNGRVSNSSRAFFSSDSPNQIANKILQNTEGGFGKLQISDPHDLMTDLSIKTRWCSPDAVTMDDQTYFKIPVGLDFKSPESALALIQIEKRRYPTMVGAGVLTWESRIKIPEPFTISHLPKDRHFSNATGSYDAHYSIKDNTILVTREFSVNKDVYTSKEYPALKSLLYQSVEDSRAIVGLKRVG